MPDSRTHLLLRGPAFVLVVLGSFMMNAQALSQNRAIYTRDELLAMAKKRHEMITTMNVTFTCDQISGSTEQWMPDGNLIKAIGVYQTQHIVFSPDGFLNENMLQSDAAFRDSESRRCVSYNGSVVCLYTPAGNSKPPRLAIINQQPRYYLEEGFSPELRTYGVEFCDMQLLSPSFPNGTGNTDMSLLSLLGAEAAVVREYTEDFLGHECHVVDLYDPSNTTTLVLLTVWIDASQSCQPVRQIHYVMAGLESREALVEYQVLETREVITGLWLGTKGYKHVFQTNTLRGIPEREWEIQLARDDSGLPALAVNEKVDPLTYDLWEQVPPGTVCVVVDTQEEWVARADDIEGIVGEFLATLPLKTDHAPLGSPVVGELMQPSSSYEASAGGRLTWPMLMACSIATAVFLMLPGSRGRHSSSRTDSGPITNASTALQG